MRKVEIAESDGNADLQVYTASHEQGQLDDSQLVTLRLESGNYLHFQPDPGEQCNVIPVHLYKKATKDYQLRYVRTGNVTLRAYGGTKPPVVGQVPIKVWRQETPCLLDCQIVENAEIRPLLGRRACLGMNIVKYVDNDAINCPQTGHAEVHAASEQSTSLTASDLS